MAAAEWLLLKLAAERIGAPRLLPAWRGGALRSVPSETIVREVMRTGAAKLNRALLEGTLPLRGVKHGTDEEIDIPSSVAGRLILDCDSNCLMRLSSQGRRRLIEYRSVKARLTDVERLEQEARAQTKRPKATKRDREKEAARVEAAAALKAAMRAATLAKATATALAAAEAKAIALAADTPPPPNPPKRQRGRPAGQPTVATRDAKTIDEFGEQHLKDTLIRTMSKPSVARRLRAARAERDANK
jgi:hypothetical protein